MAWELPVLDLGQFVAGEDLSAAQYTWVKLDPATGKIVQCDEAGELALGVLQNAPKADESTSVRVLGVSKIRVGANESFTAGQTVGTDASGRATSVEMAATGASLGDFVTGRMLESVANGDGDGALGTVLVGPMGRVTA